jgi:hypothetical protein
VINVILREIVIRLVDIHFIGADRPDIFACDGWVPDLPARQNVKTQMKLFGNRRSDHETARGDSNDDGV